MLSEPELSGNVDAGGLRPRTTDSPRRYGRTRYMALGEVILCSGFPTQILLIQLMALCGFVPLDERGMFSLTYVCTLLMADAVLVVALIMLLLRMHDERPRTLLLGQRPVGRELLLGTLLIPVVIAFAFGTLASIQELAPWLHNVPSNPLETLVRNRTDALVFGAVAVVAGGVREEIQRAFVLRRFEQHLGGVFVGLVFFSLAFGLGHLMQGWDAAITTGSLGAVWGVTYVWRRSVLGPVVSHSGFNVAEIIYFTLSV